MLKGIGSKNNNDDDYCKTNSNQMKTSIIKGKSIFIIIIYLLHSLFFAFALLLEKLQIHEKYKQFRKIIHSTNKKNTASGFSVFKQCSLDSKKSKHNYYRHKDCMKRFCGYLLELATKVINYEKMELISITE